MLTSFAGIIDKAKNGSFRNALFISGFSQKRLEAVAQACGDGFIRPMFAGRSEALKRCREIFASIPAGFIETEDDDDALCRSVRLVKDGQVDIVVQGNLNQARFADCILGPAGARVANRLPSFISVFEPPEKDRIIMVTDSYLNDFPDLSGKTMIIENALVLASALEISHPNVAALTSIEQVNIQIPSTLDAAVLSKMSERGYFGKACIEGPIDIDCALDRRAARRKGVESPVAGDCHVYMTPDIESGYALAQLLAFVGRFRVAGIVAGALCPVILDIPFIPADSLPVELALASLLCESGREK